MAERWTIRVFNGPAESQWCQSLEAVVKSFQGLISWDTTPALDAIECRTSHSAGISSIELPYLSGRDFEICEKLGELLSCPWLEARVQEGSHWDYSLFQGAEHLDNFSTLPEYWDDDPEWLATQRGNLGLLAGIWGIDEPRIANYLRSWGWREVSEDMYETVRRGKAYPGDEHEYGEIWQVLDFIHALGAKWPSSDINDTRQHSLVFAPHMT